MRWAALGLVALASCSALTTFDGLVGQGNLDAGSSQKLDASGDAGANDAAASDSGNADAVSCDLMQPFGAPVAVAGLDTEADEGSARFRPTSSPSISNPIAAAA